MLKIFCNFLGISMLEGSVCDVYLILSWNGYLSYLHKNGNCIEIIYSVKNGKKAQSCNVEIIFQDLVCVWYFHNVLFPDGYLSISLTKVLEQCAKSNYSEQ